MHAWYGWEGWLVADSKELVKIVNKVFRLIDGAFDSSKRSVIIPTLFWSPLDWRRYIASREFQPCAFGLRNIPSKRRCILSHKYIDTNDCCLFYKYISFFYTSLVSVRKIPDARAKELAKFLVFCMSQERSLRR